MLKRSIHQKINTIPNTYIPNKGDLKCKWKIDITERNNRQATIIVRFFNIPTSIVDKTSKKKIIKYIKDLNNTTVLEFFREIEPMECL